MKAVVHFGQNLNQHLVSCRNANFEELKTLFDITQMLILDQDIEILNVPTIEWKFTPWMRSTWLHDKGTHLLRFSVLSWNDARTLRS